MDTASGVAVTKDNYGGELHGFAQLAGVFYSASTLYNDVAAQIKLALQ